jgi:hypothetical protein
MEIKLAIFKNRIGLPVQNAQPELLLPPLRPAIQAKEPSPIIKKRTSTINYLKKRKRVGNIHFNVRLRFG